MTQIQLTQHIDASPERVWSALADFGGVYKFNPLVERSPLLSSQLSGLGAERRCEFTDGNQVCERVIAYEEGRSLTIEIYEGSMPLACAEGTISVEPAEGGTDVSFEFGYVPKMGLLGRLMDVLMIKRQLTKNLGLVLSGLEAHLQTGSVIGADGAPIGVVAAA